VIRSHTTYDIPLSSSTGEHESATGPKGEEPMTTTECTLDIHKEVWDLGGVLKADIYNKDNPSDPVVHADQTLVVKVTITLTGRILHYLCNTELCVCVALESCGRALDQDYCKPVKLYPCETDTYSVEFEIEGGTLDSGECGRQYEVCIVLSSKDCCGKVGFIFGSCKDINITVVPADVN
jgi:hypothetical protein